MLCLVGLSDSLPCESKMRHTNKQGSSIMHVVFIVCLMNFVYIRNEFCACPDLMHASLLYLKNPIKPPKSRFFRFLCVDFLIASSTTRAAQTRPK